MTGGSDRIKARVLRGGSWTNTAVNCRAANRNRNLPGNRNRNNGFRLALVPGSEARRGPRTTSLPVPHRLVCVVETLGKPLPRSDT